MSGMERKTISAHELNKYAYCPYQWYYERLYGRKELRRLYHERNERLSLEDSLSSHFTKGEHYHNASYFWLRLKQLLWRIVVVAVVVGGVAGYLLLRYGTV